MGNQELLGHRKIQTTRGCILIGFDELRQGRESPTVHNRGTRAGHLRERGRYSQIKSVWRRIGPGGPPGLQNQRGA